jgi:hypothetical protein
MTKTEDLHRFLNALRIMYSIDRHELVEAGVFEADNDKQWNRFTADPLLWLIKAEDHQAIAVWGIIEARQPKPKVATGMSPN